jgi:uncharacterized membrane protein
MKRRFAVIKSYDEMMKSLKKSESVPDNIFNKISFSIANNQAKKEVPNKKFNLFFSPLAISLIMLLMMYGVSNFTGQLNDDEKDAGWHQLIERSYYDKYFLDINEEFLF